MVIFGGLAVMFVILGFFLVAVCLITPFVVFAIKGNLDKALERLTALEKRMAEIETKTSGLRDKPNED